MKKIESVFGLHSAIATLHHHPETIQVIYLQQGREDKRLQEVIALAADLDITIHYAAKTKLDAMTEGQAHQGVVLQCKVIQSQDLFQLLDNLSQPPFLLLLDGVKDPQNLGACLRTADAAGVHAVIAPKDGAVGLTSVAKKAASGAAESVPFIQVTNLARTMEQLKERGIWLYGAVCEESSRSLFETDVRGPKAFVLGAEGEGLRRLTKERCDQLVYIPLQGTVSSLNVSVATGICLFEAVRQESKGASNN